MQHVQTVVAALLPIPNAEHAVVDMDLGVVFIKLSDAHNAIPEPQNEEDTCENLVDATLAGEDDGAAALDAHN
uniref:Uncharacterized protein n=1 Tax=Arundo donax TaxID=35708 RepID=A0A0A9C5U7_ARUDO